MRVGFWRVCGVREADLCRSSIVTKSEKTFTNISIPCVQSKVLWQILVYSGTEPLTGCQSFRHQLNKGFRFRQESALPFQVIFPVFFNKWWRQTSASITTFMGRFVSILEKFAAIKVISVCQPHWLIAEPAIMLNSGQPPKHCFVEFSPYHLGMYTCILIPHFIDTTTYYAWNPSLIATSKSRKLHNRISSPVLGVLNTLYQKFLNYRLQLGYWLCVPWYYK